MWQAAGAVNQRGAECRERVICPAFVARQMSGLFAPNTLGGTCGVNWRYGMFW